MGRTAMTISLCTVGLAIPACAGLIGGPLGVAACTAVGAGIGLYVAGKSGATPLGPPILIGGLALVTSAAGAFGGPIGAGVVTGLGALLGLGCDAVDRATGGNS
jgi:hypothetical protein